jgi:hypothetical protein
MSVSSPFIQRPIATSLLGVMLGGAAAVEPRVGKLRFVLSWRRSGQMRPTLSAKS